MSICVKITIAVIAASALLSPLHAQAFESAAKEAILVDLTGHRVLYEKNADEHMPTSSMSKMMTIYMVFDALKAGKIKLDDEFTVSEHAWRQTYKQDESSMFLPINGRVKVEDLIRGVIIQSGNDATVVLAEGLAGSESQFVDEMNEKAKQIGLTDSHFMNPHGMPDPNHYSTARDLATLAERLIVDFPEYYHYFGELEFTYNGIKLGRGRAENRPYRRRRLRADGFGHPRRQAPGRRRQRPAQHAGARRRSAVPARLRLQRIQSLYAVQTRRDGPA
jgi:D-alanyl-D-alanine carboxypeptidase (penicillin-binding protein 5/6)